MLKEKLEKILKKEDGNNKNKIEKLTFFLVTLIITVIAINYIWKDDKKENSDSTNSTKLADNVQTSTSSNNTLEDKLEDILSNINGVGNVKVLITYNESEEIVPVYNKTNKTSSTNETDSAGGTRVVEENDTSQEVVLQDNNIITQKTVSPKIEGAIITAQGAGDVYVKSNIIQAVEAVTGLATHKIQVFEKK